MKKKMFFAGISVLAFGLVLAACASMSTGDLAGVTTYYVRADGNDGDNGLSEGTPFKTLQRAVQAASTTKVKMITVIGTLQGGVLIKNTDPTPKQIGGNIVPQSETTLADGMRMFQLYPVIKGSYDDPDPDEIVITGKSDATGADRAVIRTIGGSITIEKATVRFENIVIGGAAEMPCIYIGSGVLTLAQGTVITGNNNSEVIGTNRGILIMRDNAAISGNIGSGVSLQNGSVLVMRDRASITNNRAADDGGGIEMTGSTTYMLGNAKISGNSSDGSGGGIFASGIREGGFYPQIIMRENSSITENSAEAGGGIYLNLGNVDMEDNAQITGNTAFNFGGGVFILPEAPYSDLRIQSPLALETATGSSKALALKVHGNTAPQIPDANEFKLVPSAL